MTRPKLKQPSRSDFPSEIEFARAMQRWALQEPPHNQRLICINDWFAEEMLLIDQAQTAERSRATPTTPRSNQEVLKGERS